MSRFRAFSASLLAIALGAVAGCGMGTDAAGSSTAALVTSGMPTCDISLLHPQLAVGGSTVLPGKLIVYVDGVMACVDDAPKVEALLSRMGGGGLKDLVPAQTEVARKN